MSKQLQKVLIVDDSQTNLALLDHLLSQEGCEIVQAKNGIEAVELVRRNDFALILLDIQMPGMNGYEAAMHIKELDRGRHVPIIFITAIYQDEENIKQGYESGAVDYMFRPVDVQALKSKVQIFLQMNQQKALLEREIEQRKAVEAQLRKAEEKYRSLFERAVEGIFQRTSDGKYLEANPALVKLLGYDSASELIGVSGSWDSIMAFEEERRAYREGLARDGLVSNFEFRARRRSGEIIWCSESSRVVPACDEHPELVEGVVEDITKRKRTELELRHLATVDSLTGIPNRHLFFDRLEHALASAKRYGVGIAVLFIDLDEFKKVNDSKGHQVGDELLRMVAERLSQRIREADTLARLGGDEFGVLLEGPDGAESASVVAGGLLEVLESPFVINGEQVCVGATIGISLYPENGRDSMTLVSRADAAMYHAKKRGGHKFGYFSECGE
ncbi:GGDEF domain-containing response regulator [Pseudodesulfovibrio tunisiensis]|uniref:GGDEF domain-containing response regulator n=1 Tax=Pseudodesulfovibrio tunisiensis TaxID=463192 RepID=UPI001FB4C62A|nr:diguanylate cyclase [Pseudodesulfovibrio tunisiensis]